MPHTGALIDSSALARLAIKSFSSHPCRLLGLGLGFKASCTGPGWVSRSAAVPTPSMWKVRRAGEDALRKGSGLIYADLNLESKICLWLGLGHMLSCVFDPSCFALRTWPGMRISGCTVFGPSAKEPPTFPARQPVVRRISLKSCSVPAGPVLHKRR